ncbi:ABC transporter permease [Mycoplasmopsis gallopavonis]|uniref:Spermidine/putrescine ABC transporter membrane protein n=1 Tax=Mycoplasmopsis gallopavonis TaxID=76629 RepID=A0A449B083_9BACT|nr:ABC transporter permease subunit [Mycoplasmopsis gallopavonis]RIV16424.1 ABC transporter permease subunit [Mycoplasmopsis gallopavonis]VEU73138.1 spermidine/putrescine ABC transporter membrane protein [Mycoplasmopsis gallopavonis]
MNKLTEYLRKSYIYIILLLVYIPLVFAVIFSFNEKSPKGEFNPYYTPFTIENYLEFLQNDRLKALVNTFLLAIIVSILVVSLSLVTVYSLYRQKNKNLKRFVQGTSNIPLINPDNITAIGLVLVFGIFIGVISTEDEGFMRLIVAHTIMALPYGIMLMLPRSEKFNNNLYEASQDLGHSKFRSWMKTYLVYMIPSIIMVVIVSSVLSFDDFIIARTVSNTSTLGTKLYEGAFEPWGLVLGSIVLFITIIGNVIYTIAKSRRKA